MSQVHLSFGAMVEPIEQQLKAQGLLFIDCEQPQLDADAITRLLIRGLLTSTEAGRARKRLVERVRKLIEFERGRSAKP